MIRYFLCISRKELGLPSSFFVPYLKAGSISGLFSYDFVTKVLYEFHRVLCTLSASIVQGAVDDLKVVIDNSRAEVVFDNLPEIYGDAALLTQLFQNLISNAIKFCNDQTPRIVVDVKTGADGNWLISVADNGIGIADASRQKIFEPFSRLNSIDAYAGSGLGLATCERIIERHGGEIWCESTLGEGTTFFFTLPRPGFETDGQIAA